MCIFGCAWVCVYEYCVHVCAYIMCVLILFVHENECMCCIYVGCVFNYMYVCM